MKKYNTIIVIDGTTNGIAKIEREKNDHANEYFNVYITASFQPVYTRNVHVSITKEDLVKLIDNIKNKEMTFIGVTDTLDEIIDENNWYTQITM